MKSSLMAHPIMHSLSLIALLSCVSLTGLAALMGHSVVILINMMMMLMTIQHLLLQQSTDQLDHTMMDPYYWFTNIKRQL